MSRRIIAVVNLEAEPPELLGTFLRHEEDAVIYADTGADRAEHVAPADCVRVVELVV